MVGLTYTTFVNSLVNLMPVPAATDPGFVIDLPNIIDDASNRILRDMDLLQTVVTDVSAPTVPGSRNVVLPSTNGTFVVVEGINVITPAGTTTPSSGTRNPVLPATIDVLNFLYPSTLGSSVPQYFARFTDPVVSLGPFPDAAYTLEILGTIRPAPLSPTVTTTFLSVYFPDVLLAAAMVRASGYMKNYGAAVDDPKMALTWEAHYNSLLTPAKVEEARKKFQSQGWSSKEPAPIATPPRT